MPESLKVDSMILAKARMTFNTLPTIYPDFHEEQALWEKGMHYVAGMDEVGRGAFAGPVVAAAVILPTDFPQNLGINDSKLVKVKKREELAEVIKQKALSYSIAEVCVPCINQMGIGKATQKAFRKAIRSLAIAPQFILMDAFYIQGVTKKLQKPIIKGDQKSLSIAAASIIAKVYRDSLMKSLPKEYSSYNFFQNKGYGTKAHREAITLYGLSKLHRTSFNLSEWTPPQV